jgi:predicted Zn-dependent protease with MMP-like domain
LHVISSINAIKLEVDDRFLAYLELRKDTFFHKIPTEKICYYIDGALAYGKQLAVTADFVDSSELCDRLGVMVIKEITGKTETVRGTLELAKNKKTIRMYQQPLRQIARDHNITLAQLEEAVLLHELFHLLEEQTRSTTEQLERVETMQFLGFKRTAAVRQTREIAAHAFVKERMQLPFLPNYWDYS